MRTPGDDLDLAAGFLVSEGIVGRADDVERIRICPGDCGHPDHDGNVADVGPAGRPPAAVRHGSAGQRPGVGRAGAEGGDAGIPVLAAVSAPTSAAAGLAADTGLTLVGFLCGGSMNVCTGEHRVAAAGG